MSQGGEYVAFSRDRGAGQTRHIHLLSGRDGSPVARLTWTRDRPATGPLAFLGSYLFAGMGFGFDGTPWNTEFIYLFDLIDRPHGSEAAAANLRVPQHAFHVHL